MYKLSPSLLAADACFLSKAAEDVRLGGAQLLHLDIMDGHFVPNLSFGPGVVKALSDFSPLKLDVHLMVEKPSGFIRAFAKAGADILNIHAEAQTPEILKAALKEIRHLGICPAITLKPSTPLSAVEEFLELVDMILVMSVEPGFSGQAFMPESLDRVHRLRKLLDSRNPVCEIEIDGGINLENCADCLDAGADILVAGSSVFCTDNPMEATSEFMRIIKAHQRSSGK